MLLFPSAYRTCFTSSMAISQLLSKKESHKSKGRMRNAKKMTHRRFELRTFSALNNQRLLD